ncbi:MAG: flavodoxin family protein [Clostridiales Family XIII bacterium]|jgi:multimeric flavodoxin WrbA|nr:flavodoxin family protein [Clostridiales Family XIII bacterium]
MMRILLLTGNPKKDGLCKSIADAIIRGATDAGADVTQMSTEKISRCRVCGDGWGTCASGRSCAFGDDGFNDIQAQIGNADAFVIITPVYWGEVEESLKSFLDKIRRCENAFLPKPTPAKFLGKPVLLVASPGGSGDGALSCLTELERFCQHVGASVFDFIGVNRWNSDYKREAAYAAGKALGSGRDIGKTV